MAQVNNDGHFFEASTLHVTKRHAGVLAHITAGHGLTLSDPRMPGLQHLLHKK